MTDFIRIIAAGMAYAVLGGLGLALAIPSGYASPIFPAAGLAIALALHYGNRILPGVFLGSLAINLAVAFQRGEPDISGLMIAVMVGAGATLQTLCARNVVLRWQGDKWSLLETEKDIALFIAAAGPLSCMVSATIGTAALFAAGILSAEELFYSWSSWWIGDTMGVILFAPLTLIFLLRARPEWKVRQVGVAVPIILTLLLVAAIFIGVARWERWETEAHIEDYGNRLAQLIDRRLVAHQEAISALRRLIEVTPDMTFEQFEYFTRNTLQDNRDIFALSFNAYVRHSDRASFERSMARKTGLPNFMITERDSNKKLVRAAPRPYYVAVGYISPMEGNMPAIGFDINSEPVRLNAIDRARNSASPTVTEPVRLVQESRERVGVLSLYPAYRKGIGLSAAQELSLIGFAVGVIKVDEMVQIATQKEVREGIVFKLSDNRAPAASRIFFESDGGRTKTAPSFVWRTQLTKTDRQWTFEVFPTAEYLRQQRSWTSWGVGLCGLLFAGLLQILGLAMTGKTALIRRRVLEQTVELTQAKQQLELLNRSLQQRVDESVSELRKKDQTLITQGRQAAMGEMIGNIAHQWRQPLNALSMLIANLKYAQHDNELTAEYLDESVATANRLIQKMSTTINDFRNFFSPEKDMSGFSAMRQIRQTVALVEASYKNDDIAIAVEEGEDCMLKGFLNEYSQVLLNLMNNARDAIRESGATTGCITIALKECGGSGVVTVRDNGGGIPEGVLARIFEPYFSTKSNGTGIGLYMSHMIIERNMNGVIKARNIDGGAEFSVSVPLWEAAA